MPIGKSIQFKFILKGSAEKILWQPGPDRIFKTWETKNTITVCEDWENPEFQKVIEEEQLANLNEPTTENSDMLIVAENLTHTKDESVSSVNKGSATAYSNTSPAEKPVAEAHKEQIIADNIAPSQENPKAIVADNMNQMKLLILSELLRLGSREFSLSSSPRPTSSLAMVLKSLRSAC
uniref:CBM20 domain-containing protein n=1 Tax=Fagus sylvatica TaxID=28930 RepID=A0A2N9HVM8_FAGSY